MLTLLDIPLSPYAQKVKLALVEKGLPFETRIPDLQQPDSEFQTANPRVEVPTLIEGDFSLFDSSIIVEYIEDRWPEPRLLPTDPRERARVRTIEEVCDTVYDATLWGMAEILVFKRADGELAKSMLTTAYTQIQALNARLERDLQNREWLNGESFGFGDIAAYPFVNGVAPLGVPPAPGSRLEAWLNKVRARPSAERVKNDIMVSIAQFMQLPADIAAGKARREYRDHRLDWMLRTGGLDIVLQGMKNKSIRFSNDF